MMQQQQVMMGMPSNQLPLHYSSSVRSTNDNDPVSQIFDQFCAADTFQGILELFQQLCDATGLYPKDHIIFYQLLKTQLMSWRAQSLWTKLDKRAMCSEYKRGLACNNTRVLIIGAGPCGLRVAIEMALLGAKAVLVEKRYSFSRNNVLHLWPFLIYDLKALGAKKFFGKFCAGSIDHISIRTLQCILLKVALLLGVEVHPDVSFEGFVEPHLEETLDGNGWRAKVSPADHPVSEFIFDICFSADGKRNTMTEFKRKELRGKFAIGLTANFINRKTQAEASVEEISGLAYIFNQKFFKDLHENVGVDLENIVYYKDETHYFVMTAKKQSLLQKGVLLQDYDDPELLLSKANVNMDALLSYAREAANYSTNYGLPNLDFAPNHSDQPDVDMFDFTSMFSAEHACRVVERLGHKLLIGLVGDTLLEPFWPTGSGCARGFLGALDGAWMVRSWASGEMSPLEVIAERESVYQLLSQTKSENLNKNYENYTIDPNTRYPNLQMQFYKPYQVQSLYDGNGRCNDVIQQYSQENSLYDSLCRRRSLLQWFQKKLEPYENLVRVVDLTGSWRSGLALCALIHRHRPHLIDVFALDPNQVESNNQLAFDILEKHCNIMPVATGHQMAEWEVPDEQMMISYLSAVQDFFKHEVPHSTRGKTVEKKSSSVRIGFAQTHKKKHAVNYSKSLKAYDHIAEPSALKDSQTLPLSRSKVNLLARDLASKFKGESTYSGEKKQMPKSVMPSTDVCSLCKERVFIVERCIAEGMLFHRQCFRCEICSGLLNITSYSFQMNGEGKEIFCHANCQETQLKTSEKRVNLFNHHVSRAILPVDRVTFNATRNKLLKQSKVNQNEMSKKEHKQDRMNQRNFFIMTHDNFSSSTEEELCFSSDSDSEKPDLSWDECVRENEAYLSPPFSEKIISSRENSREGWRIESMDDGGSDGDWETESEMDIPLQGSKGHIDDANKIEKEVNDGTREATVHQVSPVENSKPSIVHASKLQNRKAFFDAVAQPVRINARLFLGLDPQLEGGSEKKTSPDESVHIKGDHCEDDKDVETKELPEGTQEEDKERLNDVTRINQGSRLEMTSERHRKQKKRKKQPTVRRKKLKKTCEDDKDVETKELPEGTQEEDKERLNDVTRINQGSRLEMTSERHRKQKKRKKQPTVRRKKLKKTKKQSDSRKTEGVPCTTAVASTTVAAIHQTVAVVPLSGEETSSDEEETRQENEAGRVNPDSDRSGLNEVFTDGSHVGTNSILSVSSNSEQDETVTQSSGEKPDSRYLPADSDCKKEELSDNVLYSTEPEGKAPRPGLLSAEAMFSSYEEAVVETNSDQLEEFSESTGDDEDNVEPQLAEEEEVFLVKNSMEVVPIEDDAVMMLEHCNTEQNQKNKSTETDILGEVMPDENVQASYENSFKHCQIDSDFRMNLHVPQQGNNLSQLVNSGDVGQNDVLKEVETGMAIQFIDANQMKEHGSGFDDDCLGNDEDVKLARNKENLLPSAESGVEYEDEEIGTIAEEFPGLESGGTLGKRRLKKIAVKAEVESFSEDDKETTCSDLSRKQMTKKHRVNNSTQVKCSNNELRQSEETKEAIVFLAVAGVDVENDFQFIDQECGLVSVDPLSRLNCLLRSLSSSKDNVDKPLSDTLLSNEPPVVAAGIEESNICSEQNLTALLEQQSCEAMPLAIWTDEAEKEEEAVVDMLNAALEEPKKSGAFEDQCIVDENINYISPLSMNETTQKDKGQLGSSVPVSSTSVNCERCICMKDKDPDEAHMLGVDENRLLVEKEQKDTSVAETLTKGNIEMLSTITWGEMVTIELTGHQEPTDMSRMLNAQENVVKNDGNMEMFDLVEKRKINETVRKTLEVKESESLVAPTEKMITDDDVSQLSGRTTQDLSQTSAANDIQSVASNAQLAGGAAKEQDHNAVSTNIPSSVTTPCSILDAKRRFFHEISQPVRISHHTIFKDDFPLKQCSSTNQLLTEVTTGDQTLNSAASEAMRTAHVITQPEKQEEQTEDNALASREEKAKRRHLPAIPTDQVPLDVSPETFRALSEVTSPKIIRPAKGPNILSLSEGEIHQKTEQSNRRLLPSSDAFSHVTNFKSFDPTATKGNVALERHGSVPIERISLLSGNQGRTSGSSPSSSGNGQEGAITDGVKGLTLTDQTYTGITSAPKVVAENLESKDCRVTRSASLGTEINNLCVVEKTNSLRETVAKRKMTERNLTKHQKKLNNSLPELSKRTQEYHIDIKTTSEMSHQEH